MVRGSVVVSSTMSLDGFIAGPDHDMDWMFDGDFLPDEPSATVEELIRTTGAILAGRNSYDVGRRSSRTETSSAFGGRWSGPEFVLTHRPPEQTDPAVGFLSGAIDAAVDTALEAAAGGNLLVLGADVARQCLGADLVDEMVLFVLPVVLGDGIRLFSTEAGPRRLFETAHVRRWGQAVDVRLRRLR
jgi:dihydrofolate reductase